MKIPKIDARVTRLISLLVILASCLSLMSLVLGAAPAAAYIRCSTGSHEWQYSSWGQAGYCLYGDDFYGRREYRFYVDDIATDESCVWLRTRYSSSAWFDLGDGRGNDIRSCGPNTRYDTEWIGEPGVTNNVYFGVLSYGIRMYRSGNYFTLCDGSEFRVSGPSSCAP